MKWKISYGTIIPLRAPRVKKIFYFCAKARQKAFFRAGFFAAARNAKGGYPPRPDAASIALIITGIACEFLRPEETFIRTKPSRRAAPGQIQGFSGAFGIVFILLACYNLVTVTQNAGAATYAVCVCAGAALFALAPRIIGGRLPLKTVFFCAAFALSVAACMVMSAALTVAAVCLGALALGAHGRKSARLTSAAALVIAAICAMACAHCLAEVISYSGNRVVYYTDGRIFAPFAAALAVQFFMNLLEKFRPAENKEINYDNAETLD